jgi:hypothetical protein
MLFLADSGHWWEPGTSGVLDIGDVGAFLGALVAFSTVLVMVSRWWMRALRRTIREEISVATEPIQPTSNGGLSLADVARRTERLETYMKILETQNEETKELLSVIIATSVKAQEKLAQPRASRQKKKSE